MPGPWGRLVENISSKLAFFPPEPPSYDIIDDKSVGAPDGACTLKISEYPPIPGCEVFKLKTKPRKAGGGGETIICYMLRHRQATKTLLYSHGNAVDIGQMQPFLRDLADHLRVNIMAYDYSGYGQSTGDVSVNNTIADIDSAYECLQLRFKIPKKDIILYGQSVGTGPSVDLASREPELGGMILHSPLLSGIRVLNPSLKRWPNWADVYPNITLMTKVTCPTTIMHGTSDEVIDIIHGYKLQELCKSAADPLWLEGYNHQNLELSPLYLPHLRKFISSLR